MSHDVSARSCSHQYFRANPDKVHNLHLGPRPTNVTYYLLLTQIRAQFQSKSIKEISIDKNDTPKTATEY